MPQFLVYIIRFERILKSRLENSEKLGKDLFNYDLSSGSRKNTFTGLKTPQNCLFSSHLFFRQSWTKVLGHFCVSTFDIFEFQLCIGLGGGRENCLKISKMVHCFKREPRK